MRVCKSGGDLIVELEVGGGSQWLPVCLKNRRKKNKGGGSTTSPLPEGGGRTWKVPLTHGVHCFSYRKSNKYLGTVTGGRMKRGLGAGGSEPCIFVLQQLRSISESGQQTGPPAGGW